MGVCVGLICHEMCQLLSLRMPGGKCRLQPYPKDFVFYIYESPSLWNIHMLTPLWFHAKPFMANLLRSRLNLLSQNLAALANVVSPRSQSNSLEPSVFRLVFLGGAVKRVQLCSLIKESIGHTSIVDIKWLNRQHLSSRGSHDGGKEALVQ